MRCIFNFLKKKNKEIFAEYEDLTPIDKFNEDSEYFKMLDWALSNKNINNIALTGGYGAGKSSILKSYERSRSSNSYLNISLASFGENDSNEDNMLEDNKIEKSILQQIFYMAKPSKIPYTRFRKINKVNKIQLIITIILILSNVILGIVIFKPTIIADIFIKNIDILNLYIKSSLIIIGLYTGFIVLVVCNAVKFIQYFKSRFRLSKVVLQQGEIELGEVNEESIFNKYLDEILYFFEVTKYNVVFIEDLDRFDNTRIFIKLRELNSLINNCEQINRKIVFIYAIKDDVFKDKDRTKFFDLIIPVIPVINSTNSGEKLLEKMRKSNLGDDISDEFINSVSVYIDDMRILNNIYNEFIIYKKVLTDVSLKSQQMLSLIIYKNLYPDDFAKLQYNKGGVFQAFRNKEDFIKSKAKSLKEEKNSIKNKLNNAKSENLFTIRELKVVFLDHIKYYLKDIENQNINDIRGIGLEWNNIKPVSDFLHEDFDLLKLLNKNDININTEYGIRNIKIKELEKGVVFKYSDRLNLIKVKNLENENELKEKIKVLEEKERCIFSWSLKKIIDEYGIEEILTGDILEKKSIIYLLRNGFIDETYNNYLTYFYPNSLTVSDMDFILSIRNREAYEFSYGLIKIEKVISKLNDYEFEQEEILNFNLLEYLLENKEKYEKYLDKIFKQFSKENEKQILFLDQFKNHTQHEDVFWTLICKKWNNIWAFISQKSDYTIEEKNNYLSKIIKYNNPECLQKLNIDDILKVDIEKNKKFLNLVNEIEVSKVIDIITYFKIKFEMIDITNENEEILNYIFSKNHYKINKSNIINFIILKYPDYLTDTINSNYSTIKKINYKPMLEYINENLEEYVEKVFLLLEDNKNEEIETIIELVNNNKLSFELKSKIIRKENFKIDDIRSIHKSLWSTLFAEVKVRATWENIIYYYTNADEIDTELFNFLNIEEIYLPLSKEKYEFNEEIDKYNNNVKLKFINELINSNIRIEVLKCLLESVNSKMDDCSIENLNSEVMNLVIDLNILEFNENNFNKIKEYFGDKCIKFIEKNYINYLAELEVYKLDNDYLCKVLRLECFSIEEKKEIMELIDINSINLAISEILFDLVNTNNYCYSYEEKTYKKIWNNIIDKNKKILLLAGHVESLEKDIITNCLNELGKDFSIITQFQKRPKLDYTQNNIKLVEALKKADYISSYTVIEGTSKKIKQIQINTKNK